MHLARVLVVDDLDTATNVSRKIGRDWARIVTLGGEVVVPTGAITGGRAGKQGPNLLARKREIAELGERLDGSLKRLDAARASVERLAAEEGTLRGQLAKVEAQLNETVASIRGAQAGVSAAKLAAEKVAREAKAHEQQLQTIINQINVDEGNAAKLSAAISDADLSDEGAQATREDFVKRQASLSLKRDEQREASRQLAADVAPHLRVG
jgi:chromosome segregation protein